MTREAKIQRRCMICTIKALAWEHAAIERTGLRSQQRNQPCAVMIHTALSEGVGSGDGVRFGMGLY